MSVLVKTVTVGGRELPLAGSDADPYFQNIEAFAAQTAPLYQFVSRHVEDGLILDVGGNIGLTALAISLAAPRSRIVAFEPSPANVSLFEANTRGHTRIALERCGLGDAAGTLDFVESPAGANCHVATSDYEYALSRDFQPLKVPITTLDSYLEETKPSERVVLVKIDVEGFEPNVLAGARRLIEQQRPLIWMEFNSITLNVAQGYSPMAFARALFDCFEVLRMDDHGTLRPIPSAGTLVHDNITLHGSIEDVVLRPRTTCKIPDVVAMTVPRSVHGELQRLRRIAATARS
jgi:FkbM family methyltransferase